VNVKRDIRFRVYIAFTGICLLGLAIILKAAAIQVKEGRQLRQLAVDMHMKTETIPAERGNIYTEAGELLCSSIPQFDIHLDPTVVKKDTFNKYLDTLCRGIYAILGTKTPGIYKTELLQAYADSNHYYELCRKITYDKYIALRNLPVFRLGKRKGGFIADAQTRRVRPYEMLASRTIGLWRQNAQNVGLEGTFDSLLRGIDGSRVVQKMTGGVYMPVEGTEYEPQNGYDVVTTIDLNIQNVAENAMLSVLEKYQCLYGTAIVMEVNTGKIRALVNLGRDSASGKYIEKQNYALTPAEPGSTFKLVTLLSLLNDGLINVEDNVDCEGGAIRFGNRVMRDSHLGLGVLSIKEAYAHSSNAAMAKLAYQNYYKEPEKFIRHIRELQVDKRTGIDVAGEPRPFLATPDNEKIWNSTTLPWLATGYGVIITPLRTCMLYNGVANGGRMMKPYLVSAIRQYGREVKRFEPTAVVEKMGDTGVINQLKKCTAEVVLSGTGKEIKSPFYNISGKTGTAQVADRIEGKWYPYSAGIYQGSFVGYFPSEAPKYTICVVIRTRPHAGTYYGGLLAAPVFRMISDKIFASAMGSWSAGIDSIVRKGEKAVVGRQTTAASYQQLLNALGVQAVKDAIDKHAIACVSTDSSKNVLLRQQAVIKGMVPDVSGMSLRDAVYLLETAGLQVQVSGRGAVQSQSIAPGTQATKGQTIIIQLS
jgi:cell division protein FtsI (penicillin-binding protein 3)